MSSPVLNQAARILKLVQTGLPADQALRESLAQNRHFTDPAGRRAVSRAVFVYFRWWRWLDPKDSLQKQTEAALRLQERFEQNPASFKPETLAALAVPEWLKSEITLPVETLRQFQRDPVLWIRTRAGSGESVAQRLGHCTPPDFRTPISELRSSFRYTGTKDLYRTPEFQGGEFEIQDLASQLVGHACAPQPGETWWDACAGEGGKTMHLSDLMQGKGLIWTSDRSARRLAKLRERAARARVFNYRAVEWDGGAKLPTKTKFDGILVDAPCSGVGTWQRNPHARWTTTPDDVRELAAVQARLLNHVAGSLKPGGRLIYSVCTLTRSETTAVAESFTASHPEYEPSSVFLPQNGDEWRASSADKSRPHSSAERDSTPPSTLGPQLFLWPHELNANGMFFAVWRRR